MRRRSSPEVASGEARQRLLADESCDFAVVLALRAAGHDVTAVVEGTRGVDDQQVLESALHENRVLITEDKDFGQLFFAAARPSGTVILIRYPAGRRSTLPNAVAEFLNEPGRQLTGCFIVVQPGRIRISPAPDMP